MVAAWCTFTSSKGAPSAQHSPNLTDPVRYSVLVRVVTVFEYETPPATADDGSVMAFRHRELPIHSVQFHPESIATEHGHAMLANFLTLAGLPVRTREAA